MRKERQGGGGDVKHRESGSRGVRGGCSKRFRNKGSMKGEEERRAGLKMRSGRKCRLRRGCLRAFFLSLSLTPLPLSPLTRSSLVPSWRPLLPRPVPPPCQPPPPLCPPVQGAEALNRL